ncbi:MAG: M48 family metalloprotease [Desulfonatronovibrio sp.]
MLNQLLRFSFTIFLALLLILPPSAVHPSIFGEFTISDEAELGDKIHRLIRSRFEIIEDSEITNYIRKISEKLEKASPPQPFPAKVDVVNHNAVNAFATVAGYMVIFTGLILNVESEDELASIMAHELAHITQRHVARNIERSKLISIGSLIGILAGVFIGSDAGNAVAVGSMAGGQSAVLKYSRADEREADQVGLNYLINAEYNPEAMLSAMQKMRKMQWFSGGDIPSYLSTHPGMDERTGYLQDRLERLDPELITRKIHDTKHRRIQTLVRARYTDPSIALSQFQENNQDTCLNFLGKAIANSRMNKVGDAERNFRQLIECNDEDPLFLREAGIFYFQFGEVDQAGKLLQKVVMINPSDTTAMLYYARVLAEKGNISDAVKYMQRTLERIPENPRAHEHLARIFGRNGDNFNAHLHMAYAHIFDNNQRQASFHREKAREIAESPQAENKMEKIDNAYKEQSEFWK